MFQKVFSVLIPLIRRQLEPFNRVALVFWNLFPKQIEFAEGILGVLIALFRCGSEPADGGFCVFRYLLALEQQFSQAVLGKLVSKFRRECEPLQRGWRIYGQTCVTRKVQLSKGKSGETVSLLRRKCEQFHRLLNVFFYFLTFPIDFAERILRAVLAGFRCLCQPLQCLGCLLWC